MPDGDLVHGGLARIYQEPYKWLCDQKANNDECARRLQKALLKDIQSIGDSFVIVAKQLGEIIDPAIFRLSDPRSLYGRIDPQKIDDLIQSLDAPHYTKSLISRACKKFLNALRYGQSSDETSIAQAIIKQCMTEVYQSFFKQRIPLVDKHHNGIDTISLYERIEEIEPTLKKAMDQWTINAENDGTVSNLRLPKRQNIVPVDLDENLL